MLTKANIEEILIANKQEHLASTLKSLEGEEKQEFLRQLQTIDFPFLNNVCPL